MSLQEKAWKAFHAAAPLRAHSQAINNACSDFILTIAAPFEETKKIHTLTDDESRRFIARFNRCIRGIKSC